MSDEMGGMEDEEEVGMLAVSSECKLEDENCEDTAPETNDEIDEQKETFSINVMNNMFSVQAYFLVRSLLHFELSSIHLNTLLHFSAL
jgi:hypothetical protein